MMEPVKACRKYIFDKVTAAANIIAGHNEVRANKVPGTYIRKGVHLL